MFDTHMDYLQCASEAFQIECGLTLVVLNSNPYVQMSTQVSRALRHKRITI